MKEKLKPCPFCGSREHLYETWFDGAYHVGCGFGGCEFSLSAVTIEKLVLKWNRRDETI